MSQAIAGAAENVSLTESPSAGWIGRSLPLMAVPREQWDALATQPLEANGFLDAGFVLNAALHARKGEGAVALTAFAGQRLTGLLPVVPATRAYGLPLPALVATQPYNSLSTPLLDPRAPVDAALALIDAAAGAGAALLVLPMLALEGPAYEALQAAIAARGLNAVTHNSYERAALATELDDETYLRSGMGSKKLKELRRQSHRLADEGAVAFTVARGPEAVGAALDRFLALEASGWKGQRRTGLGQHEGDATFARSMAADMAARGLFEVTELTLDGRLLASGLVMRQADRALFFKIAFDEAMARFSVGVQLTTEMTRRFIADTSLKLVDSTASAGHPMIDHVWRERLRVGDLYLSTRPGDALGPLVGRLIRLRHEARNGIKRLYHLARNRLEK